jgi:3-hydroxyacyl-CoA dehydrogenase
MSLEIESVGIVGAGAMGAALAEALALAGLPAILVRAGGGRTALVSERIRRSLTIRGRSAAASALERLIITSDRDAVASCSLVIEAVAEDLVSKREVLADLDGRLPAVAILASTTRALRLADLAASLRVPRIIGLHLPAARPPAPIEIAHGPGIDGDVVPALARLAARMGRTAVAALDVHARPRRGAA